LDGDLYLVCWDGEILSNLQLSADIPAEEESVPGIGNASQPDADWFQKAQNLMIDARQVQVMGKLIGNPS